MTTKNIHIIVIGNEKGGAGKTTTSIHLIISLLHLGFKVASVDVDCRQQSLSRYLENRTNYALKHSINVHSPKHFILDTLDKLGNRNNRGGGSSSDNNASSNTNNQYDQYQSQELIDKLKRIVIEESNSIDSCDFLVIDTPGNKTALSSYAHSLADTIITPINDSFLDLDVIAQVEADSLKMLVPSFYAQEIWEQKIEKAKNSQGEINWVVLRNRLSSIDAKNKQRMAKALEGISARLGCRIAYGFNERVIYRELFLQGLTLLDIKAGVKDVVLNISHIAAKQELNNFLHQLGISKLNDALTKAKMH